MMQLAVFREGVGFIRILPYLFHKCALATAIWRGPALLGFEK